MRSLSEPVISSPGISSTIRRLFVTTGSLDDSDTNAAIRNNSNIPLALKKRLKVRWNTSIRVILIPTRTEYSDARLAQELWWNEDDYSVFKRAAVDELRVAMKLLQVDSRTALRTMYQPAVTSTTTTSTVTTTTTTSTATTTTTSVITTRTIGDSSVVGVAGVGAPAAVDSDPDLKKLCDLCIDEDNTGDASLLLAVCSSPLVNAIGDNQLTNGTMDPLTPSSSTSSFASLSQSLASEPPVHIVNSPSRSTTVLPIVPSSASIESTTSSTAGSTDSSKLHGCSDDMTRNTPPPHPPLEDALNGQFISTVAYSPLDSSNGHINNSNRNAMQHSSTKSIRSMPSPLGALLADSLAANRLPKPQTQPPSPSNASFGLLATASQTPDFLRRKQQFQVSQKYNKSDPVQIRSTTTTPSGRRSKSNSRNKQISSSCKDNSSAGDGLGRLGGLVMNGAAMTLSSDGRTNILPPPILRRSVSDDESYLAMSLSSGHDLTARWMPGGGDGADGDHLAACGDLAGSGHAYSYSNSTFNHGMVGVTSNTSGQQLTSANYSALAPIGLMALV